MTIVEFAQLRGSDGDEFARRVQSALDVLASSSACTDARAYRCIEEPDAFIFAVTWDSVDAHHEFRASSRFAEYRSHIQDLLVGAPSFLHYSLVATAGRET
jgi:quinol monooxygenase YgiN